MSEEKSIFEQVTEGLTIVFDVVLVFFLSIPVIISTIYKSFFFTQKDIRGKLALVTGGGNGLGQGICLKLAESGCNVAVVDVNIKAAEDTANNIRRQFKVQAKAYKVDVTKSDEILKLRDELLNDLGTVDILVNNAGLMSNANMQEKPEYIEMMVKVNVLGPMLMTKYFLEQMKRLQSGHIVSISSMSALNATPFSIPYTATKFGINGFMAALTEHLRLEKLRSKIKTTCVFPYYIKTRADVVDFLSPNIRFPPLEVEETAHEVVEAIKREDFNVTIPNHQKPLCKFLSIFPLGVQELSRDRILREYDFVNPNCKLNFEFN